MISLNLIVFGFNPWSSMWKRTQTLVSLLKQEDGIGDILFVNPEIHFMDIVRKPARLQSSAYRELMSYLIPRRVSPGITVFTPIVLPLTYKGKALEPLRHWLEMKTIGPYIKKGFILYLNSLVREDNPVFWKLFEHSRYRIFDWSDDFSTFAENEEEKSIDEDIARRFIENSNLVVAVNENLAARARKLKKNSFCLRNGTNFNHMRLADSEETVPHRQCSKLERPIIGYMGYMNPTRIDTCLIYDIAKENPGWQFVFIGPQVTENPLGKDLPKLKNIHIFPPVPYSELPGVLKCFDVCIIPNQINKHTAGNDPIKLFDYLASGRPIVSTPTAGLEQFDGIVDVADGPQEFAMHIRRRLIDKDKLQSKNRRIRAARDNSWETRAERFGRLIRECVFGDQRE